MQATLAIGNEAISSTQLVPLLDRYQLLPQLQRELVIDQAIASIQCTPAEIAQAYEQLANQYRAEAEAVKAALSDRYQLSSKELEQWVTRPLRIEKFKWERWGPKLESYFLQCKDQLDQVIYSLLRTRTGAIASELYFRLIENEQPFTELASTYSEGLEARMGGFVGPISMRNLHPQIAQLLSSSQPGQLLQPQHIDEWFVIVRLETRIPAQFNDAMQQQLLNELFEIWLAEQLRS